VTLAWDASPSPDVGHYILAVALRTLLGWQTTEFGEQPIYSVPAWTDVGQTAGLTLPNPVGDPPIGGVWYYSVDAVDWAGNRSAGK
jgi:hypothetical protein